jgi:hypothetical protein
MRNYPSQYFDRLKTNASYAGIANETLDVRAQILLAHAWMIALQNVLKSCTVSLPMHNHAQYLFPCTIMHSISSLAHTFVPQVQVVLPVLIT